MGQSSTQSFCLKMLVAKEENKVILAESDKEFIEVLFSFMIMPIGSVIRRTRNCLPGDIGCLNNLYASVENLDMNFLQSERCRDILLNPRSTAEIYCKNLQPRLTESHSNQLYVCRGLDCKLISYVETGTCRCGEVLKYKVKNLPKSSFFPGEEGVFLKSTARFIITDNLKVMPVSTLTGVTLLNELEKYGKIEERAIKIGRDEVLELLKCSLRSSTPLSQIFLGQSFDKPGYDSTYSPGGMNPSQKVNFWKKSINIRLKLIFDKVSNTALYAVVDECFLSLLCTFLTLPLGYIFHQFPSLSFEGCMGNLHKSIQDTQVNLFCHKELKEVLVNPELPPGLAYNGNIFGINEANISFECSSLSTHFSANCRILSSKTMNQGKKEVFEGFIKGPSMFMVTDNLEIKPLSPISVKSLVNKLEVPFYDIGEQEMIFDEDKALRLFAASCASKNALTVTFLSKETNIDCLDFLRLMWGGKGNKIDKNGREH